MKFKFTKNWNSQKAGGTYELPNQLANMLQKQGYGEIVEVPKRTGIIEGGPELTGERGPELEPTSQAKGSPNEKPKSKAKRS